MTQRFRSKIDLWLGLILGVVPLLLLRPLWQLLQGPGQWPVALLLALLGIGLPLSVLAATWYTVTDTALIVRCGLFRWSVPLADITALEPTQDVLSSPALSLDRLRVDYGPGRSLMISPRQREAFRAALRARGVTFA